MLLESVIVVLRDTQTNHTQLQYAVQQFRWCKD